MCSEQSRSYNHFTDEKAGLTKVKRLAQDHTVETSPAFIESGNLLDPNLGPVRNAQDDGQEVEK